jgi:hypothetical protein
MEELELMTFRNPDGMECFASYLVRTYDNEILAVDLIGAETAVKAVWASLMARRHINYGYQRLVLQANRSWMTVREKLDNNGPGLVRWHVMPRIDDDSVVVFGWNNVIPFPQALYGVLSRHSVWPVLPEWSEALFALGHEHNLIRPLHADGCDYAYLVNLSGWDNALDEGVKNGLITV